MPGKAKSERRKSRDRSAMKENLILEAVQLYESENKARRALGSATSFGYRAAACRVEEKNFRETKKWISIDHNTIRNRHQKLNRSQVISSFELNSLLTHEQEVVVAEYCLELANLGFPLSNRRIRECADRILQSQDPAFHGVGEKWAHRFIHERWSNVLGTYWSRSLESVRGGAVNPYTIGMFFDLMVEENEKVGGFEQGNIYGGDESGLMTGIGQKERVVGGKGKKTQHQKREVNRENTTVIATICADGTAIPPIVIFKGKHYQVKWLQDNPIEASIGYSQKGWTDGEIGLAWVQDFDNRTAAKAAGKPRLLLVDGHNSHYSVMLLDYAVKNGIVIICYPAHTTHVLQGLDIACFGSFKTYWAQESLSFERTTGQKVGKTNFLTPLSQAWTRTFTKSTITSAFSKTGIYPLNRDAITPDMMAPSKETSIQAHLPVTVSSPVRKLASCVAIQRVLSSTLYIAEAELQDTLQDTSLSFLVSSSPIKSSSALPLLSFSRLSPTPMDIDDMLLWEPISSQAALFQRALRESKAREDRARMTIGVERTRLVLSDMHVGRLKSHLYKKEESVAKKGKEKLMGDGLPRVLTSDSFRDAVKVNREVQESAKTDKDTRKAEKESVAKVRGLWETEQMKIDEANQVLKEKYDCDLVLWQSESDEARRVKRRVGWLKPKRPLKIPPLPKVWIKSRVKKPVDGTGEDSGSESEEEEGGAV